MSKTPLSLLGREILGASAQRVDHLAHLPERLPIVAQRSVGWSLLKAGLLEEVSAQDGQPTWRTAADGSQFTLRATATGLQAVCEEVAIPKLGAEQIEPLAPDADGGEFLPCDSPAGRAPGPRSRQRLTLWFAAQAILQALVHLLGPGMVGCSSPVRF